MHELSLTQNLLDVVMQHASGKQVKKIRLKIGMLSCIDATAIGNCFDSIKERYANVENALLEIESVFPQAKCDHCQHQFELRRLGDACRCGSFNYQLIGGDELTLLDIFF